MPALDLFEDARAAEIAAWAAHRAHATRGTCTRPDGTFDFEHIAESQRLTEAAFAATRGLVNLMIERAAPAMPEQGDR